MECHRGGYLQTHGHKIGVLIQVAENEPESNRQRNTGRLHHARVMETVSKHRVGD